MKQSIEIALETLNSAVSQELANERARADMAERSHQALLNRLHAVLADLPAPANDDEQIEIAKPSCPKKSRQSSYDDALLNCLSTEWIKAGQIREVLLARQIKISEGTVYNRMRKLAAERTDEIETATSPERWRLKAPKKGAEAANTPSLSPTKEKRSKKAAQPNVTPLRGADVPATARPTTSLVPAAEIVSSESQGGATLYRGDCLEVMRQMPSGSVDLIFTSPPYNIGMTHNGRRQTLKKTKMWRSADFGQGYASYDDARDPAEYIAWQKEILRECWRLLSPKGAIFYQHKPRIQNKLMTTPLDYNPDLPLRQIVIWNRKGGNNFNQAFFVPAHEWIAVFAKPDFRLAKGGWNATDVWTINPERNNPHPAPFPVELPRTAIAATDADVVFDPFMGSGSTGVAAMQCGRKFIGIELEGSYLENARLRMEAEKSRLDKGETELKPLKNVGRAKRKPAISANDNDSPLGSFGTGSGKACLPKVGSTNVDIQTEARDCKSTIPAIQAERSANGRANALIPCVPITPIAQTSNVTIYQGDCLEVMRQLPSGSVDLVVTSPPYNLGLTKRTNPRSSKDSNWKNAKLYDGYGDYDDNMPHDEYVAWMRDVLSECWRLISDDGAIYFNHKPRIKKGNLWLPHELNPGLPLRQNIIWDRGLGFNFGSTFYTPSHEYIMMFAKPKFRLLEGKPLDVWSFGFARKNDHPAPFPVELPLRAIRHTNAKTILDPFMGSGTTGVAAKMLGRKFVGIERYAEYVTNAVERIEATSRSSDNDNDGGHAKASA